MPTEDGRLLSPHNPGLSVLVMPGFALGGLVGAQVQLMLIAAAAMALAFLLAERLTRLPRVCWLVTLGVGLAATPFIYSTEVYPEFPAALALIISLLLVTRKEGLRPADAAYVAIALSVLCWLGVKYVPLAALVSIYFLLRANTSGRLTLVVLGGLSTTLFVWFHLATFDGLTPYGVNVVYAGLSTGEIVESHVELGERAYRLWGLFVDRRFGVGRWAPLLLMSIPGMVLMARGAPIHRLILVLVSIQVLIATFAAITMMGWWFPGRTLLTVLPLMVIPIALVAERVPAWARAAMALLALYGATVTAGLAHAGHAGEITIAVDPFDLAFLPFRGTANLFPDYTSWTGETWVLTIVWLTLAAISIPVAFLSTTAGRSRSGSLPS